MTTSITIIAITLGALAIWLTWRETRRCWCGHRRMDHSVVHGCTQPRARNAGYMCSCWKFER